MFIPKNGMIPVVKLKNTEVERPSNAGAYWKAVEHKDAVDAADKLLKANKVGFHNRTAHVCPVKGIVSLTYILSEKCGKKWNRCLVFRYSNNRNYTTSLFSGIVREGGWGIVLEKYVSNNKMTLEASIEDIFGELLQQHLDGKDKEKRWMSLMKSTPLNQDRIDVWVSRSGRAMKNSRMGSWSLAGKMIDKIIKNSKDKDVTIFDVFVMCRSVWRTVTTDIYQLEIQKIVKDCCPIQMKQIRVK